MDLSELWQAGLSRKAALTGAGDNQACRETGEMGETRMSGYFGIGVVNSKTHANIGTLWRSASVFGAAFIFTVARRYNQQPTDVWKSWRHIPLWNFSSVNDLKAALPFSCVLIGVELDARAKPLSVFTHPERAIYLLGAEDSGLPEEIKKECHALIVIPGSHCLNVATAGSIVMYDRQTKMDGCIANN